MNTVEWIDSSESLPEFGEHVLIVNLLNPWVWVITFKGVKP